MDSDNFLYWAMAAIIATFLLLLLMGGMKAVLSKHCGDCNCPKDRK